MDFETLFEEDTETWAELQVTAIRRLADMSGPWANAVDFENVIEEIEEVGSDQRRAVESLLENAFAHALKIAADPQSLSAENWKKEIIVFLDQARSKIRPAVKTRIDLDNIWRRACRQASNALEAYDRTIVNVPSICPCSLEQILNGALDAHLYLNLIGESGSVSR